MIIRLSSGKEIELTRDELCELFGNKNHFIQNSNKSPLNQYPYYSNFDVTDNIDCVEAPKS